ncbi:hypothetical protein [Nostoc sp. PA-18-2419]|uniref:hypothetical protein n=1 Tax=Nostoc sp. PA-18-2419 TaxID=2575443 RepID=UPI001109F3E0|nr:hypothetical protein [Nostoc sp. PA-18-2419]
MKKIKAIVLAVLMAITVWMGMVGHTEASLATPKETAASNASAPPPVRKPKVTLNPVNTAPPKVLPTNYPLRPGIDPNTGRPVKLPPINKTNDNSV